jgi:putative DNA primase/helicase
MKPNSIPEELKQLNNWCCYQILPDEVKPNKMKKMPKNAKTGGNAMSNNRDTWSSYEEAVIGLRKYGFNGLGFFFADGYFGVDIDGVEHEVEAFKHGEMDNIVGEFIHTLQSYAEYSVSGNGIHIICKGELPPGGRRKNNVEMYQEGRFFIMTANPASEYTEIKDCTAAIKPLHEKYIGGTTSKVSPNAPRQLELSENEIINKIRESSQGQLFDLLYSGSWQGLYTSQSEADMAFANILAFWFQGDFMKMDAMYRSSGLMREKWDRRQSGTTLGAIVLNKAIRDCREFYTPQEQYSITIKTSTPKEEIKNKKYTLDDTGNAERFLDTFGNELKYNYTNKQWIRYDGRKWCDDTVDSVKSYADRFITRMQRELFKECDPDDSDMLKTIQKHIKAARSSKGKENFIKEAKHMAPIENNDMDKDIYLLNTPNGILDLQTGELMEHDPKKLISKISYTEYTDKTDCPLWIEFLDTVFNGDQELIHYIQKAIGYSLTGSTAEQCAFFLHGSGGNGKGVFVETVAHIAGSYSANIQAESLMIKSTASTGQANSDIARLVGTRFVTCSEPNEGVKLNEGLIKQLTGEDRVTARRLYANEFEFKPQFKIWLSTNHKPIIRGTDNGIWRRMRLIPFTVEIPPEKQDKKLKYKLLKETPGILKWAVEGFLMYQKEGLEPPSSIKQATAEYRNEMDVVTAFLDSCTINKPGAEIQASALYKAYTEWAKENNEYIMSNRKFGIEVGKKYEKIRKSQGQTYVGIDFTLAFKPYKINFRGGA